MSIIEARIDLDAIAANVALLRTKAGNAEVMAVVKADGYGHGIVPAGRAALAGGASWLGVTAISEALELRSAGVESSILAWLIGPDDPPADLQAAISAGVDLSASSREVLTAVAAAARDTSRGAKLHLKVDSGLGRAGAMPREWPDLVESAAKFAAEGVVDVVGVWSHLAFADDPFHPTVDAQRSVFEQALEVATAAGLSPRWRHLANSAATLSRPDLAYDLVRPGIAVYGLTPGPKVGGTADLGLRPAMTLCATVALAKRVPAGHGVSYGHRYHAPEETTLALVPVGYADGVPRAATNQAEVWLGRKRRRIAGTVCMDQFVVDVGDDAVAAGDQVILWGPGDGGEPTADDWAAAIGTINYEIVTRIGSRVRRSYSGAIAGELG